MANRKSGILLHPSSLPSAFGVGDFGQAAYTFLDRLWGDFVRTTLHNII